MPNLAVVERKYMCGWVGVLWLVVAGVSGCAEEIAAPAAEGDPCQRDGDCAPVACGGVRVCVRGRCEQMSQSGDGLVRACADGGILVQPDAAQPSATPGMRDR
ncbi:MAG: hypothetical protein OXU20_01545 [Myxococcales bacterium]|nr:hypothetical protein [Myxococcales bacterium]